MHKRTLFTLIRLLLAFVALYLGVSPSSAEPPASQQTQKKVTGPPKGCKAGQMRCINNAKRRAAAIRNADRRAQWMRQHKGGK